MHEFKQMDVTFTLKGVPQMYQQDDLGSLKTDLREIAASIIRKPHLQPDEVLNFEVDCPIDVEVLANPRNLRGELKIHSRLVADGAAKDLQYAFLSAIQARWPETPITLEVAPYNVSIEALTVRYHPKEELQLA